MPTAIFIGDDLDMVNISGMPISWGLKKGIVVTAIPNQFKILGAEFEQGKLLFMHSHDPSSSDSTTNSLVDHLDRLSGRFPKTGPPAFVLAIGGQVICWLGGVGLLFLIYPAVYRGAFFSRFLFLLKRYMTSFSPDFTN